MSVIGFQLEHLLDRELPPSKKASPPLDRSGCQTMIPHVLGELRAIMAEMGQENGREEMVSGLAPTQDKGAI